ncbi:uncharacterized protein LOC114915493 [Cajanus cajan]|nr:uncharacterized protein LOC114915493 [Cajanus cajan]
MTGDHSIMFRYVGLRLFDITVWINPSNLKSIDEATNPSRSCGNPNPVSPSENRRPSYTKKVFKVVLNEYKASGRQLSLPVEFGDHLRKRRWKTLNICGPVEMVKCSIIIPSEGRKSVKLGKDWKFFCYKNQFVAEDELEFSFPHDRRNLAHVMKIEN